MFAWAAVDFASAPEFFFSGLAMKRIYAYGVFYVRYLEIAWTIQRQNPNKIEPARSWTLKGPVRAP